MTPSQSVLERILDCAKRIDKNYIELGCLFSETLSKEYYTSWGYPSFAEWIAASDLDVNHAQARQLVNIVDKAAKMNINLEKLEKIRISKLRLIFSLDEEKYAELINKLLKDAPHATTVSLRSEINKAAPNEDAVVHTSGLAITVFLHPEREQVIRGAMRIVKDEGKATNNGDALYVICLAYMNSLAGLSKAA